MHVKLLHNLGLSSVKGASLNDLHKVAWNFDQE